MILFILEPPSMLFYDLPKLPKPSYGKFRRFKNPIFPNLFEIAHFTYKVSYQKVFLNKVS
jgi:hypothetical protein